MLLLIWKILVSWVAAVAIQRLHASGSGEWLKILGSPAIDAQCVGRLIYPRVLMQLMNRSGLSQDVGACIAEMLQVSLQ